MPPVIDNLFFRRVDARSYALVRIAVAIAALVNWLQLFGRRHQYFGGAITMIDGDTLNRAAGTEPYWSIFTYATSDLAVTLTCLAALVAIVMLGADLRVRRFTPPAAALLNLIGTDIGRPLADLKPKIDAPELEQWIVQVTETLVPVHQVVRGGDGRSYDLRVKPYRTADNKIDGVVLTIVDRAREDKEEH